MISRRKFLGAGSAAALGAVVSSVASGGGVAKASSAGATPATRAAFERLLHSTFRVHREALSIVPIRLVEVTGPTRLSSPPPPEHEMFSLVFQGPAEAPLSQGTYRMEHDSAGEFTIFIVPVGRRGDDVLYEAVFNRSA